MDRPVLVYFDGRVQCNHCDGHGADDVGFCIICDGSGIMDTIDFVEREDVEPVKFLEGAA